MTRAAVPIVTLLTVKLVPSILKMALEVPAVVEITCMSSEKSVDAVTAIPDDAQVAAAPVPKQYRQLAFVVGSASHHTPVVG